MNERGKKKSIAKKGLIVTLFVGIPILAVLSFAAYAKNTNLEERVWMRKYVNVVNKEEGNSVIKIISNEMAVSYLDLIFQQAVTDRINETIKKGSYTIEYPLVVLNPYGTNRNSVNVYFHSKEKSYLQYTISVEGGKYSDFTKTMMNDDENNLSKKHEYQLLGLIPGEINTVSLSLYNETDKRIGAYSFQVNMTKEESQAAAMLTTTEGSSKSELTEGFYTLFGNNSDFEANIYMYDNNGVIRGEIPVEGYRGDRLLFIDQNLVYSYDNNKMAKVNRLGQIIDKYLFEGYEFHHDYAYDSLNQKILILATELDKETAEDIIIQLDLKTGETSELIDFKDLMPENYKKAVKPDNKEALDWIHFNSIQIVNGNDLILSARELSSIVAVSNIYESPRLKYLLADESIWEDSSYKPYVYKKKGDFTAQAGQHTVTYVKDGGLQSGQYYLYMYNNNLVFSGTRPDYNWSAYKGAGTHKNPADSYYYRYLVDENAETFELVESFKVPYSSYVSSAQEIGDNYVICSGLVTNFGEYDSEGKLIRQFNLSKYAYRAYKYDFNGVYFKPSSKFAVSS